MSDNQLNSARFPRSSRYHPGWVLAGVSGGANSLWLTEWLTEAMPLLPGMRVLDLGCGRGASSIFLRREFGVQVWATDLWFSATERLERVHDAGVDDGVFPISADARALPFAFGFFDAIISIDSFPTTGPTTCMRATWPSSSKPAARSASPEPGWSERSKAPFPSNYGGGGSRLCAASIRPSEAPALGSKLRPGRRAGRQHARRLASLARVAADRLPGQQRGDRGPGSRCRSLPRLRPRRRAASFRRRSRPTPNVGAG